jgi:hypothetical protein
MICNSPREYIYTALTGPTLAWHIRLRLQYLATEELQRASQSYSMCEQASRAARVTAPVVHLSRFSFLPPACKALTNNPSTSFMRQSFKGFAHAQSTLRIEDLLLSLCSNA